MRDLRDKWFVASVSAPVEDRISKHVYQGWSPCMWWCAEHFNTQDWRYVGEGVFEFRRSEDHLMFILRWA
jgi:hypothetical protein